MNRSRFGGLPMRMMHLCYAAIGGAVARWIFRRQGLAVADPVTHFQVAGPAVERFSKIRACASPLRLPFGQRTVVAFLIQCPRAYRYQGLPESSRFLAPLHTINSGSDSPVSRGERFATLCRSFQNAIDSCAGDPCWLR